MLRMPAMSRDDAIAWLVQQPEARDFLFWSLRWRMQLDPTTGLFKGSEAVPRKGRAPKPEKTSPFGGRPPEHAFSDYAYIFPSAESPGMELGPLHRLLVTVKDLPKKSLHTALRRWEEAGIIYVIRPEGKPMRYRLARVEVEV